MNAPAPSILNALSPSDIEDVAERRAVLAEIDASCRNTLLLLFGASLTWLLLGTVFALIASWKMHAPEFLADISWLTFGRWPCFTTGTACITWWAVRCRPG